MEICFKPYYNWITFNTKNKHDAAKTWKKF